MSGAIVMMRLDEAGVGRLAEEIALLVARGDLITLSGDLGAGKTTLARALIGALLGGAGEEIPSPTFTLVQTYQTPRMTVAHLDLYRLADPAELDELGLEPALDSGIALVEWPERAGESLPEERLEIHLEEITDTDGGERNVTLRASPRWQSRLERLVRLHDLLEAAGWTGRDDRLAFLQGDASVRRYARLTRPDGTGAIVMDWPAQPDGPAIRNGLPYSRIAHLAEGVRPFVAIAEALAAGGIATPAILAHDLACGLLVLEDLGANSFGAALAAGADQRELWRAAVDVLIALRTHRPPDTMPVPDGTHHRLPPYDAAALAIETELVVDWLWPALHGVPADADTRQSFASLWAPHLDALAGMAEGWVLRDFHSPNLIWRPHLSGLARVGVIDFQDALLGPAAYDLVSLLQDARLDVPADLERELLDIYMRCAAECDRLFDRQRFQLAYAALGAQRNTKILGIFARLAVRDGKPGYLAHLPRIWGYLERNLAHPRLAALAAFYEGAFPTPMRRQIPCIAGAPPALQSARGAT